MSGQAISNHATDCVGKRGVVFQEEGIQLLNQRFQRWSLGMDINFTPSLSGM